MSARLRPRSERGVVFPSPVVILSIVAVAMAAIAYVATRGQEPTEREVTIASSTPSATVTPTPSMPTTKPKPTKPAIDKGKVYVEVYNNSGVTGLAGRIAATATAAGWKVVGSDNWYGTIPASTVYYPAKLERAARALALDLGIRRTARAVDPMRLDRLTVILTADHA
jgi:LytR cell envelope-related transcriptional attenuator